ncbi:DUF1667 domain-containing protein [Alkalithermobacter paradoxus]|uniref:4Fe-4S Mo/W bis-MGD-type domain-containing protein n=1 Tax=Alkalithermobacter paradoxus TaxID=29349 RepID=A0A1V4I913_9FIRM|nr:hypothetical protein CLOTH_11950 [[Clostridium] thermoalcaliphilum]
MQRDLVCIVCPIGCRMSIEKTDSKDYKVSLNKCKRGEKYAIEEVTNPKRMITTTVRINNGQLRLIPVKTKDAVPKEMIFEIMEYLDDIVVEAPIKLGDIIVENILNTGVDIVATRNMEKER